MRKLPSLNAIRAFEAAARHQSFTEAAKELCVTVTAVSHQIRHLEAVLGVKLFERTARAVFLSPAGEKLFPLIRDGFDRLADAFAELNEQHSGGAITMTTTRAFAERWLMPRLLRFNDAFPDIVVHVDASEHVVDLRAAGMDIAIRYGRVADQTPKASVLIKDVHFAVVDRAICPEGRTPSIEDFRNRPLLAFRWLNRSLDAPNWSNWLTGVPHDAAQDFRVSWFSDETLALNAMERGFGPLLCSNIFVDDKIRTGALRRLDGPSLSGFAYRLVQVPSKARKRSVAVFSEWLKSEAADFTAVH